jgi:hypothetical protein
MITRIRVVSVWVLLVLPVFHAERACAADPCGQFAWDVGHERALFAASPESITAGARADSAPALSADRLYRLALAEESKVTFAATPERKRAGERPYAGLARLHIRVAGTYRVALSRPFWIDIVQDGKLVSSAGFTGSHGCDAPRKIVQYALQAGDYVLQVSGPDSPDVNLTLTAAPPAAAAH